MPPHRHSAVPNFGALRSEFRRRRRDAGLTYDALAEKTGVSRRTLISIENGQSNGSVESWYRIAGALDIDMADLMRSLYSADK
jgi:transcriptional regulator with XRE-family HTH domain